MRWACGLIHGVPNTAVIRAVSIKGQVLVGLAFRGCIRAAARAFITIIIVNYCLFLAISSLRIYIAPGLSELDDEKEVYVSSSVFG